MIDARYPMSLISRLTNLDLARGAVDRIYMEEKAKKEQKKLEQVKETVQEIYGMRGQKAPIETPATRGEVLRPDTITIKDPETYGEANQ
jgi:hypothetical protein